MSRQVNRLGILLPLLALAGGCSLLPDASSSCKKPQPYQSAQEMPPLQVPEGATAPDTKAAMRVPEVKAPQLPRADGGCLDHPPGYGSAQVPKG